MSFRLMSLVILINSSLFLYSQVKLDNVNAYSFTVVQKNDSIQFIKLGGDIHQRKGVIIFCQGSLPIPLIVIDSNGDHFFPAINFNMDYLSKSYHLVLISPPNIPLVANDTNLDSQFAFVENKNIPYSYPIGYLSNNYLEKYVERAQYVIDFLRTQEWVDPNRLIIVGHSQGSRIATKVAAGNSKVFAVGYFSGNPLGRIDESIWKIKISTYKNELSQDEAQRKLDNIYNDWRKMNTESSEYEFRSILSFSKPILDDLLRITQPLYITFGTNDETAFYCNFLPIEFIRKGKCNYEFVPRIGYDHNFFEVDSMNKPDYSKCHWDDVMKDFLIWIEAYQSCE
ncbi:MAG: hypothetical protein ACK5JU_01610 [Bacteroidales bacterium]